MEACTDMARLSHDKNWISLQSDIVSFNFLFSNTDAEHVQGPPLILRHWLSTVKGVLVFFSQQTETGT